MNDFARAVSDTASSAMCAERLDTLTINIGLLCNMSCSHCHQSSSPLRTELMSRADMESVARIVEFTGPNLVDITGGAPELHPELPFLLGLLSDLDAPVRLRTNLTALLDPRADGLIELLVRDRIGILASLPDSGPEVGRAQRGDVFDRSVEALQLLSSAGFGRRPELRLGIAVNPEGPVLGRPCDFGESFREAIEGGLGIPFDDLVLITNMPVGRFSEQLLRSGTLGSYRQDLRDAFNPDTVAHLSCRTSLSIGWDGTLADCDFNLGAGLGVMDGFPAHISEFDGGVLATRPIRFADHCFGCTALEGSG